MKDSYCGKLDLLMKETEGDTNKWKIIPCSQTEELMLLKCPHYLKQSKSVKSPSKYQ